MTGLAVMAERDDTARPPALGQRAATPEVARVCVGRIAGAQGVRGEVRIEQKKCMGYCRFGPVVKIVGGELFMHTTREMVPDIAEKARNAAPPAEGEEAEE